MSCDTNLNNEGDTSMVSRYISVKIETSRTGTILFCEKETDRENRKKKRWYIMYTIF